MLRIDFDSRTDGVDQVLSAHLHGLAVALDGDTGIARDVAGVIAQPVEGAFQMVFENVRHGHEIDVFIAGEQIHDRLRAAAPATHQAGP